MPRKKKSPYIRRGIYNINEVLDFVPSSFKKLYIAGDGGKLSVKLNSSRYKTFKKDDCTCVFCGLRGSYFALETHREYGQVSQSYYHFNLYGIKDGKEILFTKDHIIPVAKNGGNKQENFQTLCTNCNNGKGALIINSHEELIEAKKTLNGMPLGAFNKYKKNLNRKFKSKLIIAIFLRYPFLKKLYSKIEWWYNINIRKPIFRMFKIRKKKHVSS